MSDWENEDDSIVIGRARIEFVPGAGLTVTDTGTKTQLSIGPVIGGAKQFTGAVTVSNTLTTSVGITTLGAAASLTQSTAAAPTGDRSVLALTTSGASASDYLIQGTGTSPNVFLVNASGGMTAASLTGLSSTPLVVQAGGASAATFRSAGAGTTTLGQGSGATAILGSALTVTPNTTFNGSVDVSGANTLTVGTGLTSLGGGLTVSAGTVTISPFASAGVVKNNASGVLSTGTVNLASTSEVSGTLPVTNGGTGAATLTANGIVQANGTGALTTISPAAAGTVLRSNGTTASFTQLAAGDIDNTGTGKFLVNVPGTVAANLVTPTTAAVPGITIQQGLTGTPTNIFAVESNAGTNNFLKVDGSGNTTIGHAGITSGNTLTVQTGATTGNAVNVASGATTGIGVNVTTATTTGAGVSILTGSGVTSGASGSGTALHIDTGTSTFSNGTNPSTRGGALNIRSTGVFSGIGGEAALVRVNASGNFTGTLVNLIADSTTSGTILGISGTSLTTGKAIDVKLGGLYSGQVDGQGDIGAVNIRAGAFTGNILSVSATSAGAGASSNLVNFQSPQIDGRLVNVNVTGAYGGAGAVAINAASSVSGTLLRIGGTSITTGNALQIHLGVPSNGAGCPGACSNPDPTGQKGINLALGTTGTGVYANTDAAYSGSFVDFRVDGVSKLSVNQAGLLTNTGGIATSGNITQTGATTFSTGTGAVSLNGDTTIASGKTLTAGAGTTAGTAVTVNTGAGLVGGTAVGINTSTSAFTTTTGAGLAVTSTGAFTGTLGKLTADSTTTGTILGIRGNAIGTGSALDVDLGGSTLSGNTQGAVAVRGTGVITGTVTGLTANFATTGTILGINGTGLSSGKAIAVDLGASTLASNTGAVQITSTGIIASGATVASLTANNATSGTLLSVSGTAIGASTGSALKVAIGTPTGTESPDAKAIQVALGTGAAGTAFYANAASGYTGDFIDFRVNGTPALTVSASGGITTTGNFSQTGATTFSTGSGAVSLGGATTVTGTNTFLVNGGLATFGGGLTISAGSFTQNGAGTFTTGTGLSTVRGAFRVSTFTAGVLLADASGNVTSLAPGASGNVLTSNGTTWVSQAPTISLLSRTVGGSAVTLSTTEATIYSVTLPANTFSTNESATFLITGALLNSSGGSRVYTLRVSVGGTTVYQDALITMGNQANARGFRMELEVHENGANAQKTSGIITISNANTTTTGTGDASLAATAITPFNGIDTTAATSGTITVLVALTSASNTATQTYTPAASLVYLYR